MARQWTCPTCGARYSITPAGSSQGPKQGQGQGSSNNTISDAQRNKIFAMIGDNKYMEETARQFCLERYNVKSARDLSKKQASELIDHLNKSSSGF